MITQDDLFQLAQAAQLAGFDVNVTQLGLLTLSKGILTHMPSALPANHSSVYIFELGDVCLKVGKAGPGSNSRYQSQHYSPVANGSTLAKSLMNDPNYMPIIGNNDVSSWIKSNIDRYNILIPNDIHTNYRFFVNFVEAFFILKCSPLYES